MHRLVGKEYEPGPIGLYRRDIDAIPILT
jgi:hypothetical protein